MSAMIETLRPDVSRMPSLVGSDETSNSSDSASLKTPSRERSFRPYAKGRRERELVLEKPLPRRTHADGHALTALRHPLVLTHVLHHTPWPDFHALTCTSRSFRRALFTAPDLKDVVLAEYVPGYRFCLRYRDLGRYRDVRLSLEDVVLFMISQSVSLHRYPTHALSLQSTWFHSAENQALTDRYAALASAHSRFVLLLQSLVYSATSPASQQDDLLAPSISQSSTKELVFPAPLSYFGENPSSTPQRSLSADSGSLLSRARSSSRVSARSNTSLFSGNNNNKTRRTSVFSSLSKSTSRSRLSIFMLGTQRPPPPPPPPQEEPTALKIYAGGWRRALRRSGAWASDEEDGGRKLDAPHRRFASMSSDSSLSSPSNSTPGLGLRPPSSSRFGGGSGSRSQSPLATAAPRLPRARSPHDLQMALSRFRAPILRVYVPCSSWTDLALERCEEQLESAGLWEHLSTGDVVCNFGYVPEEEEAGEWWLVFNGHSLVPFDPSSPPPIPNPLELPSPLYYAHVLPPSLNPTYSLALPSSPTPPHLLLSATSTLVPSLGGVAAVRTYSWLAVLPPAPKRRREGMGEGWQGEWVVQGEGTREGLRGLVRAVRGEGGEREWEVVRERCKPGRLWLKLLTPAVPSSELRARRNSRAPSAFMRF